MTKYVIIEKKIILGTVIFFSFLVNQHTYFFIYMNKREYLQAGHKSFQAQKRKPENYKGRLLMKLRFFP
jgi:hypothetical protein